MVPFRPNSLHSVLYIVIPDGVPSIIPRDLFERVQMKVEKNKRTQRAFQNELIAQIADKLVEYFSCKITAASVSSRGGDCCLDG